MSIKRTLAGGAAAIALIATTASPAIAGGYGSIGIGRSYGWGGSHVSGGLGWRSGWGGGWGRGWRRHRGDDDTAEVLGGVLLGALLVGAIASASKSSKRKERARGEDYPDYPERDDRRGDNSRGGITSEDAAVDACAIAAEERSGEASSVRDITSVARTSEGWDVNGTIETRQGWRDRTRETERFACSVRFGRVDSIRIGEGDVAYSGGE